MPSLDLLPITSLTFDGTLLMRDDRTLYLSLKRGVGEVPTVRGEDVVVPRLAGRVARARVPDRMALELEGLVVGYRDPTDGSPTEPESYYTVVREMRALFDPTKDPALLSGILPDGTLASINVRVVPPLLWDEMIPGRLAKLNVALESVDPDWAFT